uniref:Uncharacterized protein n=1 Tax=Rhizophora mucronata TaxID=61149 RepID=A0A2P2P0K8_RHIMU
MRQLWGCCH